MASLTYINEDNTLRVKIGPRDNEDAFEQAMSTKGWTCIYGEETMMVFEAEGGVTKEEARRDIKEATKMAKVSDGH